MSGRIVDHWTKTSSDAFGDMGVKGDRGEERVYAMLLEKYPLSDVYWGKDDRELQLSGIDFVVTHPTGTKTTFDAKNDLHPCKDLAYSVSKVKTSLADYWYHLDDNCEESLVIIRPEIISKYIESQADDNFFYMNNDKCIRINSEVICNLSKKHYFHRGFTPKRTTEDILHEVLGMS